MLRATGKVLSVFRFGTNRLFLRVGRKRGSVGGSVWGSELGGVMGGELGGVLKSKNACKQRHFGRLGGSVGQNNS